MDKISAEKNNEVTKGQIQNMIFLEWNFFQRQDDTVRQSEDNEGLSAL